MRCYIFLFNPSELFNENYEPTDEPVEPIKLKDICDTK